MKQAARLLALLCPLTWILVLTGCSAEAPGPGAEPAEAIADLSGLEEGWNAIEPGGETTCSDGTAYKFFVRPGAPERLVVYFEGGGACWFGGNCDPDLDPTYTVNLTDLDPSTRHGIFAFDHPENPFADHSVVFAPYCTADVHIGDRVATYQAPTAEEHEGHEVTIQHRGAVNARAVLDWTYAHFRAPRSIFVSGSSAGSIASPYYAMLLAEHYPDARLSQLGDGSGGYRGTGEVRPHEMWGTFDVLAALPEYRDMKSEDFTFESLYITAAQRHPDVTFASYDTAEDEAQKFYLDLADVETESLLVFLDANQADIRAQVTNVRSFIAGGEVHTILSRPELYTYRVGEVRLLDWISSLAAGEEVDDVRCSDCAAAEVLESAAPAAEPTG
jgi:hypothetical protein